MERLWILAMAVPNITLGTMADMAATVFTNVPKYRWNGD